MKTEVLADFIGKVRDTPDFKAWIWLALAERGEINGVSPSRSFLQEGRSTWKLFLHVL